MEEKTFDFTLELAKAESRDGRMFVSGVASTTSVDKQNEAFSINAIKTMANNAIGKPLVSSHNHEFFDEIGVIHRAEMQGDKLYIEGELDSEDAVASRLFRKIQKNPGKVGFSVGCAVPLSAIKSTSTGTRVFDNVLLNHVMITSKPVNNDTFCVAVKKALDEIDVADLEKADKEPYGSDADYADPGYQADKVKRYPLDSAEHVRAAASYFGMAKNREKYTAEQQSHIEAKIEAAKKRFGIGEDAKKSEDTNMDPQIEEVDKAGAMFSADNKAKLKQIHDAGNDDVKSMVKSLMGSEVDETFFESPAEKENPDESAMPDNGVSAEQPLANDGLAVSQEAPVSNGGDGMQMGVLGKAEIEEAISVAVAKAVADQIKDLAAKKTELESAIATFKSETAKIVAAKGSDAAPAVPKISPAELRQAHRNDTDFLSHLLHQRALRDA